MTKKPGKDYAAIIIAVSHQEYINLPETYLLSTAVTTEL